MGRPQKVQCRQPSIIDSDLDHRFSLSGSVLGSDSDTTSHGSDIVVQDIQPIIIPKKCAKPASARASNPHTPIPTPTVSMTINYVVSFFSFAKMKKAVSKQLPKCSSFQLHSEELWDTVKALMRSLVACASKQKQTQTVRGFQVA